jgi:poly-gamma-glutamate synthesis protein (capsule biosynthesis protein)
MLTVLTLALTLAAADLAAQPPTATIAAVGDVLLARTVPQRIAAHGPAWLWEKLPPAWRAADLRFCNLECPVTAVGQPVPKRFCFKADPQQAKEALAAGGVDVVSAANLAAFGIAAPGAGKGRAGAVAPRILERHGLKIAIVAYTWWTPETYVPSDDGAALATLDEDTLPAELEAAKLGADVLVVSVHWGNEYLPHPSDEQRRLGHLMIDHGADLVLGAHPHVSQGSEVYHGRPIVYSLGNAIFDRSGDKVSNGLLVLAKLTKGGAELLETDPLTIEDARPVPSKEP